MPPLSASAGCQCLGRLRRKMWPSTSALENCFGGSCLVAFCASPTSTSGFNDAQLTIVWTLPWVGVCRMKRGHECASQVADHPIQPKNAGFEQAARKALCDGRRFWLVIPEVGFPTLGSVHSALMMVTMVVMMMMIVTTVVCLCYC